jgi:hypothetical protein
MSPHPSTSTTDSAKPETRLHPWSCLSLLGRELNHWCVLRGGVPALICDK